MKTTIKLVAPILIWIFIIYSFSSQPYQQQDISVPLAEMFQAPFWERLFAPVSLHYNGELVSVQALGMGHFVEFFVRKGAHFLIYLVLSFLTARAVIGLKGITRKGLLLSVSLVILFAISDEFHQVFTEGRTPLVEDVLVDAAGGVFGLLLYIGWKKRRGASKPW